MSDMVRKQIYIYRRQETLLKRLAQQRGMSEAEIIRQAIDREAEQVRAQNGADDQVAWAEILQMVAGRRALGITGAPYRWNREDIYTQRESHWVREHTEEE
jgi:hypothetical protein